MLQKEVWVNIVGIPEENMYLHYDEKILGSILKEAEQDNSEKKIPRLLILDDCIQELNSSKKSNLLKYMIAGRHWSVSVFILLQSWLSDLRTCLKEQYTHMYI